MKKTKANFQSPLHLACSDDPMRPVMQYIFFENGYAYATNVHIAVKQSLDDYCDVIEKEKLNGHAIYKAAFAQILKFPMVVATEEGVECINDDYKVLFRYADKDMVRPNLERAIGEFKRGSVDCIGLRPHLFGLVDKVLKHWHNGARVEFQDRYKAMKVTYPDYPNQEAYIMPYDLKDVE